MAIQTAIGTTLAISANEPSTFDQAGFEALSYTTIGEVTDYSEAGATYETILHQPTVDRKPQKYKGTYDNGERTYQLGRDTSDAGQALLEAGLDGADEDTVHSFRITLPDGTDLYQTGLITNITDSVGAGNNVITRSVTVALISDEVVV